MKRMISFGGTGGHFSPNGLFKLCCISCVAAGAAIGVFCIGGAAAEEAPFMQNESYYAQNTNVMIDKSAYSETAGGLVNYSRSSASMQPGDGGLNTVLIAQMTEGYCKDYLTICLEGAEGNLSNSTKTMPIETPLCIAAAEGDGFYKIGDKKTIPLSDLPENRVENYQSGLLYTWGASEHAAGGRSSFGGPFQYTSGPGKLTTLSYKSKYSPSSSDKGDCYNFPDCVASLIQFVPDAYRDYVSDESNGVSDEVKTMLAMNGHNRGAGAPSQMAHGYRYKGDGGDFLKNLNGGKTDPAYVCRKFQEACDDLMADIKGANRMEIFNILAEDTQAKANVWPMLFHHGWYIDQSSLDFALQHKGWLDKSMRIWNLVYPTEAFSSVDAYASYVQSHYVKSLSEASGFSPSDCQKYFNTDSNGMYASYSPGVKSGNIFKVTSRTNTTRTKTFDKEVMCFDEIAVEHIFIALEMPQIIFAKMLAYSGVSVDPTNPETYRNTMVAVSVTETPQWSADSPTWLSACGVTSTNGYGPARIALLNAAYEVAFKSDGSKRVSYSMPLRQPYGSRSLEELKYLDCSSYVGWCYGYTKEKYGYDVYWKGFPYSTAAYNDGIKRLHPIDASEGKAGDIAVTHGVSGKAGHAIIFLSKIDNTHVYCLECTSGSIMGTKIGERKDTTIVPKSTTSYFRPNYRLFRCCDEQGRELDMITK